jgi:hypothetical protein
MRVSRWIDCWISLLISISLMQRDEACGSLDCYQLPVVKTFNGPVPIIIIDASMKGAGKSKLADLVSVIAAGMKASRMFYTEDDVEMDKRITALALAGEQISAYR